MDRIFVKRLALGHVSIVLVIVLSTMTSWIALRSTLRQTERSSEIEQQIAAVGDLRSNARELARSARRYLISGEPKDQQRVFAIESEIDQERTRLGLASQQLDRALDDYISTIVRNMSADRTDSGALVRYEDALRAARDRLAATFDDLVKQQRAERASVLESQHLARGAQWALVIAGSLGVILTLGSVLAVVSLLHRQADRIRTAEAVAQRATTARKDLLNASNDLREPLERIVTQATDLRRRTQNEAQQQTLQSIAQAASQVNGLMRQLLDVTAVQAGIVSLVRDPCDVSALVDRAIRHHREGAMERGIRIRYASELSASISADRDRIAKALTTLVGSAIENAKMGATIVVGASATDDGVRFEIIDADRSVPTPSTFQPAAVVAPNDLALYLTQRVVEAHGGRMGIETTAAGRTYWFTVPTEPRILT